MAILLTSSFNLNAYSIEESCTADADINDCIIAVQISMAETISAMLQAQANDIAERNSLLIELIKLKQMLEVLGSAILYEHGNYEGDAVGLLPGEYNLSQLIEKGLKNDSVSSIKVSPGYKVTAYQHGNFAGWDQEYTADTPWVGQAYNDQISAVKVEKLYNLSDVLGTYERSPINNNWHVGYIEETASGLQWRNNAGVTWSLTPDFANKQLLTGPDCPYYNNANGNGRAFTLRTNTSGDVTGFVFQGELYSLKSLSFHELDEDQMDKLKELIGN